MRLFVFVLSIALIVSTTYAHAIVWLPAVSGAVIRTAAGHYMKVASKKALAGSLFVAGGYGTNFAVNYCKKNKQKCKDWVGDVAETFFDDDTDDTNGNSNHYICNISGTDRHFVDLQAVNEFHCSLNKQQTRGIKIYSHQFHNNKEFVQFYSYCNNTHTVLSCHRSKDKELTKEQVQKIIERIKDDDPDYIINNYGDTINIEQYCSAHACDELTAEFGDEVMKNKSKYDIDKINKANCEVENNKIKSCKNAKKDKDEQETEQTDEQQTEGQGDKGDQDPIECDASAFHKKVCDFIDWYQDDTDLDDDTKVKVTDLSDELQLDKNRIKFTAQCPADKTFKMAYAGVEVSPTISYKSLCDGFIMLKPFIIGLSGIAAALIVTVGGRRG